MSFEEAIGIQQKPVAGFNGALHVGVLRLGAESERQAVLGERLHRAGRAPQEHRRMAAVAQRSRLACRSKYK